jgi:hypothetical protein
METVFFHSLSFILNKDFSMSNNYKQLICTFILQNWASWEDRILISHEHNMTKSVYTNVMLNVNGWENGNRKAGDELCKNSNYME